MALLHRRWDAIGHTAGEEFLTFRKLADDLLGCSLSCHVDPLFAWPRWTGRSDRTSLGPLQGAHSTPTATKPKPPKEPSRSTRSDYTHPTHLGKFDEHLRGLRAAPSPLLQGELHEHVQCRISTKRTER